MQMPGLGFPPGPAQRARLPGGSLGWSFPAPYPARVTGDPSGPGPPRPLPGLQKQMASVEDLPEHILVDILTWVPAADLILNCRLVCSWWRELVDWPVLWKRKLRRHGKDLGAQGSDLYYVFCHLEKNLVTNPCGEEGLDFWEILKAGEGQWKIEDVSKADSEKFQGTDFLQRNYYVKDRPQPLVQKCFTASNGSCFKSQLITLKDHGYWDELLDGSSSTIVVKDWFYYRPGCRYRLYVGLLAADFSVLREYCSEDLYEQDWERDGKQRWQKVTHTFYNCPRVRHIFFQHQVQKVKKEHPGDGIRITHSSVTLGPFSLEDDSPSESSLLSLECSCRH